MKNADILIVDHRIDLVQPLGEIFQRKGYNVSIVEDGDKAIWLLKKRNFDVLITPAQIPGVSGVWDFKVMKRLCPSMAVIIVNSVSEKKEMTEIPDSEVEAVVNKPFNVKELVQTVESILEAPSVLIVDYRVQDREALKNMLVERRYRALVARDGDEAMEMVQENDFDVVLVDAGRAGVEGTEVLETVQKIKPDIRVVMMIDYSSVRLVADLLRKGAYTCLYKPFLDVEKLVKVIEEVQSQKRIYPSLVNSEFPRS
jgi:two-component system response regulator (stage 0 sporulation protein F)